MTISEMMAELVAIMDEQVVVKAITTSDLTRWFKSDADTLTNHLLSIGATINDDETISF